MTAFHIESRGRLPLAALQTLLTRCTTQMAQSVRDTGRWLGHRLFLLDGSSFSMPDTDELRGHFGQSGEQAKGCGFFPRRIGWPCCTSAAVCFRRRSPRRCGRMT